MGAKEKKKSLQKVFKKLIGALPVRKICEYENIREKNIEERHKAMIRANSLRTLKKTRSTWLLKKIMNNKALKDSCKL